MKKLITCTMHYDDETKYCWKDDNQGTWWLYDSRTLELIESFDKKDDMYIYIDEHPLNDNHKYSNDDSLYEEDYQSEVLVSEKSKYVLPEGAAYTLYDVEHKTVKKYVTYAKSKKQARSNFIHQISIKECNSEYPKPIKLDIQNIQ